MPERPRADPAHADLSVVVGWLCLCWVVVAVPPLNGTALRPLVAVPGALVVPGYAVVVALVPHDSELPALSVERFGLAVTGSVAVCILAGVVLLSTALPVSGPSTLALLSLVTLLGVARTARRRGTLGMPSTLPSPRFPNLDPSIRPETGAVSATVAVLVGVAAVAGTLGTIGLLGVHEPAGHATLAVEPAGETASINDTYVPADTALRVSLENRRSGEATYTLVALVERLDESGGVDAVRRLDTDSVTLGPDERWTKRHRPTDIADDGPVRLAYELYRGTDAGGESRARVHLWMNRTATTKTSGAESTAVGDSGTATPSESVQNGPPSGVSGP